MTLKRKFDRMLSEGQGRQFLWLTIITLLCIGASVLCAYWLYGDQMAWQYIVGLFLDAGNYGGFYDMGFDAFRIIVSLLSVFLFSALLISVFTNVFENISKGVEEGRNRYRLRHHVLIIGGSPKAQQILDHERGKHRDVVVMAEADPHLTGDYIYYCDKRDERQALVRAGAASADIIYIIGEEQEDNHDNRSLACLGFLQQICDKADHDIHCYLTISQHTTLEVFDYMTLNESGHRLLVDVIDDNELVAEQLLVNTDFLPIIRQGDVRTSHIVIIGTSPIAQAVAFTAAHLSHYPNFARGRNKTCITFIAPGIKDWMEQLVASRPGLFQLSEYCYRAADGSTRSYQPQDAELDFLDVRWEFVDAAPHAPLSRQLLCQLAADPRTLLSVLVCQDNPAAATQTVLHLPRQLFAHDQEGCGAYRIAVYQKEEAHIIRRANETGMFGQIRVFGHPTATPRPAPLSERSKYGQRVNAIYDQRYGNPPSASAEAAWYKISEARKYSSIYCANALFLRKACYALEGDRTPIYEAEHRRWMMSVLIMGYCAGATTDKEHFVHAGITPFENLDADEQAKDKILIDCIDEIIEN